MWKRCLQIIVMGWLLSISFWVQADDHQRTVGVLALKGVEDARRTWQPLIDKLNEAQIGFHFVLQPLSFNQVATAVNNRQIDYLIANPAYYVREEVRNGLIRIATLEKLIHVEGVERNVSEFGGVIFARAGVDIKNILSLHQEDVGAVSASSLGGFLVQRYEIKKAMNLELNTKRVQFYDNHNKVVAALQKGEIEVGFVRTGVLEELGLENEFQILESHRPSPWFFQLSTQLYPEWPFAALAHIPSDESKQVLQALLHWQLRREVAAYSWRTPLNYQRVHDLLRELRLEPYQNLPKLSFSEWFMNYNRWAWFVVALLFGLITMLLLLTGKNFRFSSKSKKLYSRVDQQQEQIHELIQQNRLIDFMEARFRVLMDAVREGVVVFEHGGSIVNINPQAKRMLSHFEQDGLAQDDFYIYLGEKQRAILQQKVAQLEISSEISTRYLMGFECQPDPEHASFWFEVHALHFQGHWRLVVVITETKANGL